jgi:hypothetical protein
MTSPGNDLLLLAGKVITVLIQFFLALSAAVVALVLPILALFGTDIAEGFSDGSGVAIESLPVVPLGSFLLLVLAVIAALFVFFGKLRAIINTVGEGDPFVPANAERLSLMAWLLLGAQLLSWPLAVLALQLAEWADELENVDITLEMDGLDLTGILMVIVLFILARVFKHGAAMREDLEGTV